MILKNFFEIKDRESVLGKYSIDENGDTTLSDYGGDRIEDGKLTFDKVIKAQTRARSCGSGPAGALAPRPARVSRQL